MRKYQLYYISVSFACLCFSDDLNMPIGILGKSQVDYMLYFNGFSCVNALRTQLMYKHQLYLCFCEFRVPV